MTDAEGFLLLDDGSVHRLGIARSVTLYGGIVTVRWDPVLLPDADAWTVALGIRTGGWRTAAIIDRQRIVPGSTFTGEATISWHEAPVPDGLLRQMLLLT